MTYRPVVLAVLDGWGCRDSTHGNAIAAAELPHWRALLERWPHTTLQASGEAVGLPNGVMGNSEVGHMNLGSGRVVPQGVTVIDAAIRSGEFGENETLRRAIAHVAAQRRHAAPHGPALRRTRAQLDRASLRARSTRPSPPACRWRSTASSTVATRRRARPDATSSSSKTKLAAVGRPGAVASVTGRYYAMDRDRRWERTRRAYDLLANGQRRAPRGRRAHAAVRGGVRARRGRRVRRADASSGVRVRSRTATPSSSSTFGRTARGSSRRPSTPARRCTTTTASASFRQSAIDNPFFATMTKYDEDVHQPGAVRTAPAIRHVRRDPRCAKGCASCASPRPRSTRTSRTSSTAAARINSMARTAS